MVNLHKQLSLFLLIFSVITVLSITGCRQQSSPPLSNTPDTTAPVETATPENNTEDLEEYTFSLTNNNAIEIKQLLISNNQENWENFELGGQTIPSQEKVVLLWTKDPKVSGCEWQIKAVFSDDKQSEPISFNICQQPDLIIP